jgi:hypothetical protein
MLSSAPNPSKSLHCFFNFNWNSLKFSSSSPNLFSHCLFLLFQTKLDPVTYTRQLSCGS